MATQCQFATQIEQRLLARNEILESFFAMESHRLAEACREMSERFLRGGRLLAFGQGPYATDAQHVSVEFVHPVIVGKRALPALDLSILKSPLGLGVVAIASIFVLPLTLALVQHRVIGALGLCLSALFAPFAPLAWIAGERAERRSRYLGLYSEARNGEAGKLLGQWGTLVLVSEVTVVLFMIGVLRLSGSFRLPFDLPG